jgi:predicted MFS family arabinose efflux permease
MVPLALFRSRVFAGTNALTLLFYAALGGMFFFLPFDLIQVQGYAPAAAAAALLPFVALVSLLSPVTGALTPRLGARPLLVAGSLLSAAGYALLARTAGGSYASAYLPGILALGCGTGMVVAPLTTTVMASVERHKAGVASGVNNAVARTAGALSIAGLGVLLRADFDRTLDAAVARLRLPAADAAAVLAQRGRLGAADFAGLDEVTAAKARAAFGASYVAGFRALMVACAALALLAAVVAVVSTGAPRRAQPDAPHG